MKLTFPLVTDKVYQGDNTLGRFLSSLHIEPVKKPVPKMSSTVYQGDKALNPLLSSLHIEPVKKPLSP